MQKVQDGCVAAMVFSGGVAECVKGRRAKPRIKLSLKNTKASREASVEVRVDLIGGVTHDVLLGHFDVSRYLSMMCTHMMCVCSIVNHQRQHTSKDMDEEKIEGPVLLQKRGRGRPKKTTKKSRGRPGSSKYHGVIRRERGKLRWSLPRNVCP